MKILDIHGKLFTIVRTGRVDNLKDFKIVCDKIFKRDDIYFFCNEISDVEIESEEICSERIITEKINSFLSGMILTKENEIELLNKFVQHIQEINQLLNIEMVKYVFKKKIENKLETV